MKTILKFSIYIIFLFHISCTEDFLEQKTSHGLDLDVLATKEGIESLLIGAYSSLHLQNWPDFESPSMYISSPSGWIYGDVYADDAYIGSDLSDEFVYGYTKGLETYEALPDLPVYFHQWRAIYLGISACNNVLRAVDKGFEGQSITPEEAGQYEAEARFLRAFFHLEAIKLWDFIPFVDENNRTGYIRNKVSGTAQDDGNTEWGLIAKDGYIPWAEVEADLEFASTKLPETPRMGEAGRATKFAALGLWARNRICQGKYSNALSLLTQIIESGHYSLAPNFHDNFRIEGDNNIESLFDIQASVNDGAATLLQGNPNGNNGDLLNFPYSWNFGAPPGPGGCCGFYQPSQNLVNAYKTQNGLPYLSSYDLDFNAEGDDVINDEGLNSSDPFTPDSRPLDPRLDWTVGRRGIPYLDWGPHPGKDWIRDQDFGGPYSPIKGSYYTTDEAGLTETGWGERNTAKNYHVLRYADILLMAAECEVEANNLTRARELVNLVRNRAKSGSWVLENGAVDNGSHTGPGGEQPAANYVINEYPVGGEWDPFQNQASAREAVRFERRLEFGMEGMRFWDLKRWGVAKKVLNDYLVKESKLRKYLAGAVFEDERVRHPIPSGVIPRSIDLKGDTTIRQNPGY